ncbi:HU family DNA-binding protein [Dethiosulfatarculus sandiegensis]|nr:HU family DNA-binding protein [Dethiosulfatarculus sandiegensis]
MADKPMTKAEMIDRIANDASISKAAAKAALEAFIEMCREEVKADRPFRVAGLGTFVMRESKARKGVNPATGEPIDIKAQKRMAFKMSSVVKDMLN